MSRPKRIFIVADIKYKSIKTFVDQIPKLSKGFIRLGHDVRTFSYCNAVSHVSLIKSRTFSKWFSKPRVDELLSSQIKSYKPDIVFVNFARILDADTIRSMRKAAPDAVFVGIDGDPWPKL